MNNIRQYILPKYINDDILPKLWKLAIYIKLSGIKNLYEHNVRHLYGRLPLKTKIILYKITNAHTWLSLFWNHLSKKTILIIIKCASISSDYSTLKVLIDKMNVKIKFYGRASSKFLLREIDELRRRVDDGIFYIHNGSSGNYYRKILKIISSRNQLGIFDVRLKDNIIRAILSRCSKRSSGLSSDKMRLKMHSNNNLLMEFLTSYEKEIDRSEITFP